LDEHYRELIRDMEGRLEDLQREQREISRASDADRPLNRYDTQSLMADAQAVLVGIDYPSVGTFKSVCWGVIKAYLRGRGASATSDKINAVFDELVKTSLSTQGPACEWFRAWCKENQRRGPERDFTPSDRLKFGRTRWSGGTPSPIFRISDFGEIIVPNTPEGGFLLQTNDTSTWFKDMNALLEFASSLWDTIDHIDRSYRHVEFQVVPESYSYRVIHEWDQVIKDALGQGHAKPESDEA
jgi:hypothetical protein